MAGTGELNVLRRLRVMHGQISESVSYGTHVASHMALGLLFLGKGRTTLGTSKVATAALFCAFYPVFPSCPSENRFHLQAFRHLWVLAVEPRCLSAKDVDSGKMVYLPLRLRIHERDMEGNDTIRSQQLVAPTLIPEVHTIQSIRTDSPRYWPVTLDFGSSKSHLDTFLRTQIVYVKRRAGHLSYALDPRGIRSIFTQSKSEAGSSVFDETTARLLAVSPNHLQQFVSSCPPSFQLAKGDYKFLYSSADGNSEGSKSLSAFLASVIMECLVQDKPEALSTYRALYLAFKHPFYSEASLSAFKDIIFVAEFYKEHIFGKLLPAAGRRLPLVSKGLIDSLLSEFRTRAQSLLEDTRKQEALSSYLISSNFEWLNPYYERDSPSQTVCSIHVILLELRAPPLDILIQLRNMAFQLKREWMGSSQSFQELLRLTLIKTLERLAIGEKPDRRLVDVLVKFWG